METLKEIWDFCWPHWPGIMFIIVMWIIAQTLKTRIFTKELAKKTKAIFWLRRTFPIIILFLGVITGLTWPGETSPGVVATAHKIWYFMGCAGISIIGFNIVKQWVKKKYDIELSLPRDTTNGNSK